MSIDIENWIRANVFDGDSEKEPMVELTLSELVRIYEELADDNQQIETP